MVINFYQVEREAELRINYAIQNGKPCNPLDLRIFLGDPNQRFDISDNPEFMREQFFRLGQQRIDFLKGLKFILKGSRN